MTDDVKSFVVDAEVIIFIFLWNYYFDLRISEYPFLISSNCRLLHGTWRIRAFSPSKSSLRERERWDNTPFHHGTSMFHRPYSLNRPENRCLCLQKSEIIWLSQEILRSKIIVTFLFPFRGAYHWFSGQILLPKRLVHTTLWPFWTIKLDRLF